MRAVTIKPVKTPRTAARADEDGDDEDGDDERPTGRSSFIDPFEPASDPEPASGAVPTPSTSSSFIDPFAPPTEPAEPEAPAGLVDPFEDGTGPLESQPGRLLNPFDDEVDPAADPADAVTAPASTRRATRSTSDEPEERSVLDSFAAGVSAAVDSIPSFDDAAAAVDTARRGVEGVAFPDVADANTDAQREFEAETRRDLDGDGVIDATDTDVDNDRVLNRFDLDDDDDGVVDLFDPDDDGDGVRDRTEELSVAPTLDGVGRAVSNVNASTSDDIDPDTLPTASQRIGRASATVSDPIGRDATGEVLFTPVSEFTRDFDGDGLSDEFDLDRDGDGLRNDFDTDDDNDALSDPSDTDRDGDGFIDESETIVRESVDSGEFGDGFLPATERAVIAEQARADFAEAEAEAARQLDAEAHSLFSAEHDPSDEFGAGSVPATGGEGSILDSIGSSPSSAADFVSDKLDDFFTPDTEVVAAETPDAPADPVDDGSFQPVD